MKNFSENFLKFFFRLRYFNTKMDIETVDLERINLEDYYNLIQKLNEFSEFENLYHKIQNFYTRTKNLFKKNIFLYFLFDGILDFQNTKGKKISIKKYFISIVKEYKKSISPLFFGFFECVNPKNKLYHIQSALKYALLHFKEDFVNFCTFLKFEDVKDFFLYFLHIRLEYLDVNLHDLFFLLEDYLILTNQKDKRDCFLEEFSKKCSSAMIIKLIKENNFTLENLPNVFYKCTCEEDFLFFLKKVNEHSLQINVQEIINHPLASEKISKFLKSIFLLHYKFNFGLEFGKIKFEMDPVVYKMINNFPSFKNFIFSNINFRKFEEDYWSIENHYLKVHINISNKKQQIIEKNNLILNMLENEIFAKKFFANVRMKTLDSIIQNSLFEKESKVKLVSTITKMIMNEMYKNKNQDVNQSTNYKEKRPYIDNNPIFKVISEYDSQEKTIRRNFEDRYGMFLSLFSKYGLVLEF